MAKRRLEAETEVEAPQKKARVEKVDSLSRLSDELLLRILEHLSVVDLNTCQSLSSKFRGIAADSQLWKKAYYDRFIRPRTARIRGTPYAHLSYSSRLSNWLDDESLVRRGTDTNWKRQYKLRHNWARGACDVSEIQVAEERPLPPLLIKLHDGIVYTSDSVAGLKAWGSKKEKSLLATFQYSTGSVPSSLTVDTSPNTGTHRIVAGFKDGSFLIIAFEIDANQFLIEHKHEASSNGILLEMACHFPFLLTMTASQLFSVYKLSNCTATGRLNPPLLLHSLRSQTIWFPLSLCIRPTTSSAIVATVAYSVPTLLNWTVGIQELHFHSHSGDLLSSRMATSPSGSGVTLGSMLGPHNGSTPTTTRSSSPFPASGPFTAASPSFSKPTSLSYTHPYLLLSHPDNTLTTFLVSSTSVELNVSVGTRLWGHTSSVSGAHVEGRGKAVSVTERGEELRIWELEGSVGRKRSYPFHQDVDRNHMNSVKVTPGRREQLFHTQEDDGQDGVIRGWVGFDDDSVVVLKERSIGRQDLLVYNFG